MWSWRPTSTPPFTLDDVPGYPAHLDVDHPAHLSRGLVLVKWWLLALPHYAVVAFFVGTGAETVRVASGGLVTEGRAWRGGLIGLLAVIAGVVLAVRGTYPRSLYDLVLGLHRWVLRVAAHAALMTDVYPPFRLDQGGHDPGSVVATTASGGTVAPAHPSGPARPVFVGVAPEQDALEYLDGVQHTTIAGPGDTVRELAGGRPSVPPSETDIWAAQAAGPSPQEVRWEPAAGDWVLVVMPADSSRGLRVTTDLGASVPWLATAADVTIGVALAFVVCGAVLVERAGRSAPARSDENVRS